MVGCGVWCTEPRTRFALRVRMDGTAKKPHVGLLGGVWCTSRTSLHVQSPFSMFTLRHTCLAFYSHPHSPFPFLFSFPPSSMF